MTPILFAENATSFTTNGIGRLSSVLSCKVTEERNGQYELEMEYPITGEHYSDIGIRKIIVAKPSAGGNLQPFRIYKITKPIAGRVGVYAQHISYDLSKNVVMPFSVAASSSACSQTLAGLKTNAIESCPFTFWTDVTRIAGYSQTVPMSFRSRLGGSEGSVLDQYHGEYEFDGYTVKLHSKRGNDNGVVLRYGKNIIDLEQEENISETITGVVPFWSDMDNTETVTLPEKVVYSSYASRYSQKLTVPLDLSGDYEDKPSVATIRAAAQSYIAQNDLGVPKVSITVSFVNLRDTAEYSDIADLETVNLCDDVHVQFEPLGIDTTAEVVKCVWDVLAERYNEVTVGSLKSSLTMTLNDQNAKTVASIEKTRVQAGNAINEATAWLLSGDGYIVAIKGNDGEWKELLAMDTPDTATAQKVMRLNENGLGGSSSGIGGPYLSAILSDGTIVADRMKTGVLSDLNNKFSLNMQTGQLFMKDGTFSGTINSSVINFGSGNLLTQMKYGPTTAFGGENALLISGNDRMAIESTAYQVRVTGASTHMGVISGNSYINTTEDHVGVIAKTGARVEAGDYVYIMSSPTGGTPKGLRIDQGGIDTISCDINGYAQAPPNDTIYFYTFNSNGHNYLGITLNGSSFGSVQVS